MKDNSLTPRHSLAVSMSFTCPKLFINHICIYQTQEGYILATSKQRQNSKSTLENVHDVLTANIFGIPGKDYPNFNEIPKTQFNCDSQLYPGYYADIESDCQMYHICQPGGRKDSFLCANGTIFNQERLVCEWWHNVDCSQAKAKYSVNEAVIKAMEEIDRYNKNLNLYKKKKFLIIYLSNFINK